MEDGKSPPRHVPWSNPNEERASQKDEEAFAMEEGGGLFKEKNNATGENRQNLVVEEEIDVEHPDTVSPSRRPDVGLDADVGVGAEAVHPPPEGRQNRGFPGAFREGGLDNEEQGYDEDQLTIQSHTEPPSPPTLSAELVNAEEEERRRQDDINEVLRTELERERQKVIIAEVIPEVVSNRGRRWKFAGAFVLVILIVLAVVLGVTLSQEPTLLPSDPTDEFRSVLVSVSEVELDDPNSPQFKALNWIANDDPASTTVGITANETIKQRYAAAVLFFALDGEGWTNKYNFLSGDDICLWNHELSGVICDSTKARVLTLNMCKSNRLGDMAMPTNHECPHDSNASFSLPILAKNGLRGSIPEEIGYFSDLTTIELTDGFITGTLPSSLVELSLLAKLNLTNCKLEGTIPGFLYTHAQLTSLLLDYNSFRGTIPPSLGTSPQLVNFWVNNNKLTGSIPASVGQSSVLGSVDLSGNSLTGTIPEFSPSSRMQYLLLANNTLYGSIPSSIGNLQFLQYIWLQNTSLGGTIPTELGQCQNLTHITFDYNQLTGDIGPVVNILPRNLTQLDLSGNAFSGTVPTSIGTFTNLNLLDLGVNNLSGTIPTELGLLSKLENLNLYSNGFTGMVPASFASLTRLKLLSVYDNDLTGSVDAFCSIDIEIFAANDCAQDEIVCTCCTHCCEPETGNCNPI